jgi:hypothetical protein
VSDALGAVCAVRPHTLWRGAAGQRAHARVPAGAAGGQWRALHPATRRPWLSPRP